MHLSKKQLLRADYRARRDSLPAQERAQRSAAICARLMALPLYAQARVLHCYLPMRSEVDTRPLLAHALANARRVVVPLLRGDCAQVPMEQAWLSRLDDADLVVGWGGCPQPRAPHAAPAGVWDLVVVPLLAFDRSGQRLGYGKGCYDRLLATTSAPAVGVAFAVQEAAALPHEPFDVPLSLVVTEDEVILPGG